MNDKNIRISRIKLHNLQNLQDYSTDVKKTHNYFKPRLNLFIFESNNE